eukprot:g8418.t1
MNDISLDSPVRRELAKNDYTIRPVNLTRQDEVTNVKVLFSTAMHSCVNPSVGSVLKRLYLQYVKYVCDNELSNIDNIYFKPGGSFWVCIDQHNLKIVGIVGVEHINNDICELRRMSVHPSARNRNQLGIKLCRVAEEYGAENNYKQLILKTGSTMHDAIGLYHNAGFEDYGESAIGEKYKHLEVTGEQIFAIKFRKPLTSNQGRWIFKPFKKHHRLVNPPSAFISKYTRIPQKVDEAKGVYKVSAELEQSSLQIRTFRDQDIQEVKRIFISGMRLYCDPLPEGSVVKKMWLNYIDDAVNDDLSNIDKVYFNKGKGHFWVAVDLKNNNQIVGCVGVERKSDEICELRRMSVDVNNRKVGLGSKLVRVVEEFAAQNNYTTLYLTTGCIMSPAIGLYHRNGFEDFQENYIPENTRLGKQMKENGERFFSIGFRKRITSNSGRWFFKTFEKHPHLLETPSHLRPDGQQKGSML